MFIWCWQIWQPGIPTSPLSGANFSMEDFLAAFNRISDSNHAPQHQDIHSSGSGINE